MAAERENIRGKDVLNLIDQVRRGKTLVNMRLLENDVELLTVIDGIQTSRNGPIFAVDVPENVKKDLDAIDYRTLEFEFMDSKKVPCGFRASTLEILGDKIWVMFPDVIYREQKREHFRIEAPLGARLCFEKDNAQHLMSMSDISMGGLLITLRAGARDSQILSVGEELRGIELICSSESVKIKKAVVAWMDEGVLAPRVQFGIQFTDIHGEERRVLKEILYELQREFLARRAGRA